MEQIRYTRENIEETTRSERIEENQENVENQLDNSSKKEGLHKAMLGYQFDYIDRLKKNLIKPLEDSKYGKETEGLGDILIQNTTFGGYVGDAYVHRRHRVDWENKEEWRIHRKARKSFVNHLIQKINFLEADNQEEWSLNWKDKTLELIEKEINDLGSIIDESEKQENNRAGLIGVEQKRAGEFAFERGWVKSPFEDVINIHLEELNQQKNKDGTIKNIYSGESLSKLAEKIISECPQVKAVVAESWIVDSPIGRRIGLEVDSKSKDTSAGIGFWGQFINEKGEIKEEKINKFIETGIPDYYYTKGHIKVEDFLRKYLPKEKRGTVKLKDISPSALELRNFWVETKIKLDKNWTNMSYENIVEILNSNPSMVDLIKTPEGQNYLGLLKKIKEGVGDSVNYDEKQKIQNEIDILLKEKQNILIDREVFI